MAIHLLPLSKLALMAGKAGTSKATGAAMVKQAISISARKQVPGWLVKGALNGLIGHTDCSASSASSLEP